jgi:hypothetical protein
MEILNVTTTKSAACTTKNARYSIEFSISDNKLVKVTAGIYKLKTAGQPEDIYIGHIQSENNMVTASFTDSGIPGSGLMSDYESILEEIEKDAAAG